MMGARQPRLPSGKTATFLFVIALSFVGAILIVPASRPAHASEHQVSITEESISCNQPSTDPATPTPVVPYDSVFDSFPEEPLSKSEAHEFLNRHRYLWQGSVYQGVLYQSTLSHFLRQILMGVPIDEVDRPILVSAFAANPSHDYKDEPQKYSDELRENMDVLLEFVRVHGFGEPMVHPAWVIVCMRISVVVDLAQSGIISYVESPPYYLNRPIPPPAERHPKARVVASATATLPCIFPFLDESLEELACEWDTRHIDGLPTCHDPEHVNVLIAVDADGDAVLSWLGARGFAIVTRTGDAQGD